jgi:hypothetical protein
LTSYRLLSYEGLGHSLNPAIVQEVTAFLGQLLPHDASFVVKPKAPREMSIKELKEAVRNYGLADKAKGFMEKGEYVRLLQDHFASLGLSSESD